MIIEKTYYVCDKCGTKYSSFTPQCDCENKLTKGKVVGPFEILDTATNGTLKCQCRLCGLVKDIDSSNIRRQVSCGCKPRRIEILQFMKDNIRYKCRKCGKTNIDNLPIEVYCCDEEEK